MLRPLSRCGWRAGRKLFLESSVSLPHLASSLSLHWDAAGIAGCTARMLTGGDCAEASSKRPCPQGVAQGLRRRMTIELSLLAAVPCPSPARVLRRNGEPFDGGRQRLRQALEMLEASAHWAVLRQKTNAATNAHTHVGNCCISTPIVP